MEDIVDDEPLPLSELRGRTSEKTFAWLQNADEEEAKRYAELLGDEAATCAIPLFASDDDSEEKYERVQEWCSSLTNPDGIGGTNVYVDEEEEVEVEGVDGVLRVKYILSEVSGGHGDDLWAAARHVANILADPVRCKEILGPLMFTASDNHEERGRGSSGSSCNDIQQHPLLGKTVIELGAGAGVPSWIAMKCGARVVCTDQSIPNRIRCMAECAQRNLNEMKMQREQDADIGHDREVLRFAEKVKVCPYDWGNPIDGIIETLNEDACHTDTQSCFDVVIAADCIYMPHCHALLLDSIKMLLRKESGVALLPFALHGNTRDSNVWSIVDRAKEIGFHVVVLEPQQLTPQGAFMESKRALINMLQLSI